VNPIPYWRRLVVEAVGAFGFLFLAFSGVAVSVQSPDAITSIGVAAGFGFGLALMIFAFGHISGGHFNPAVTLGLVFGRQFPAGELAGYWIAQLVGAFSATGMAVTLYAEGVKDAMVNTPGTGDGKAMVLELIATALFVIVISSVATDRSPWSGVFAPFAIGLFIFVALMVIGPISGGSLNPARSIAPVVYAGEWSNLWIYLVGPLLGGAIGGVAYSFLRHREGAGEVEEMSEAA
jgi:MIP family channel proteins